LRATGAIFPVAAISRTCGAADAGAAHAVRAAAGGDTIFFDALKTYPVNPHEYYVCEAREKARLGTQKMRFIPCSRRSGCVLYT